MTGLPRKSEAANIPSMVDGRFLLKTIKHTLKGGLLLRKGHIPQAGHVVPENFLGVGVAASDDARVDDYIINHLHELNIKSVRIDLSYGDVTGNAGRLLRKLITEDFDVLLHLVQPFDQAHQMETKDAQDTWHQFLIEVCEHFGSDVSAIEIGTTINRRRWAGYSKPGFFAAWKIAYTELKARGITIAGPNISDFEPFYSFGLLDELGSMSMLPDIHTNNLFTERVSEPERYDHRVLGFKWAKLLKYNLVKKARLMRKAGDENGVSRFVSPAAFWTLPRIERVLVEKEQKQADYLSRYFVLLAASGSLEKAFLGPLLCAREGLIDDGSEQYPKLERITHYASVIGPLENFRARPSFYALKQVIAAISGAEYKGALATTKNIEIHAFKKDDSVVHIAWTINGKACDLANLYDESDLQKAEFKNRDGHDLGTSAHFVNESPMFLLWEGVDEVTLSVDHNLTTTSLFAHTGYGQYFPINENGWVGMLAAHDETHAEAIIKELHPDRLPTYTKENTFRKARNIIWRVPGVNDEEVVAKKPLKVAIQKLIVDRFKPSKARRSWNAAAELSRRNISTARAIAYFEKSGDKSMLENVFICEKVDHDFNIRDMFNALREGANSYQGVAEDTIYRALSEFLQQMHARGVFFRDLAGGNILVKKREPDLTFTLIDINRARFYNHPVSMPKRLSDLTRITYKLHPEGRDRFVEIYLSGMRKSKNFTFTYKVPFYLYDFKVSMKRKFGRKAIKRLFKKINEINNPVKAVVIFIFVTALTLSIGFE